MNKKVLSHSVQTFIDTHLNENIDKIALAKTHFEEVSQAELVGQILAKKKSETKLPTWFNHKEIYYPALLSIEQTSSELTAKYKSDLAIGESLADLTAGFGVDSYFFAQKVNKVISCEINQVLSTISAHNATALKVNNIMHLAVDGIAWLQHTENKLDTIYIDPARRSANGKVFRLRDCTPDVTKSLELFFQKAKRILIKTAPLLDLTAGLNELEQVSEIHIISVKNECKELLWVLDKDHYGPTKIICPALNQQVKNFSFYWGQQNVDAEMLKGTLEGFLYEPDVALLKSGAFNLTGMHFGLQKLHKQSHLYVSNELKSTFIGRVFKINEVLSLNELKKEKSLIGNVITRNFPEQAAKLVKKHKIAPSHDDFIVFTQTDGGYVAIKAKIVQHY